MPITINGTGSITGLSAGGLPDLSVATADLADGAVTTAKVADANVTAAKLDGAQSGSAPIYGARAWVNFNGTGTVAIRASANVSSITDNGTGQYTVNFTTAMPDADYSVVGIADCASGGNSPRTIGLNVTGPGGVAPTTTAARICSGADGASFVDIVTLCVAVFR